MVNEIETVSEITVQDEDILSSAETPIVFGTTDQVKAMWSDYSLYYGEVKNPQNTTMNTFFKAKYAPLNKVLDAIRPIMSKYNMSIIQYPFVNNSGMPAVGSMLIHSGGAYVVFPSLSAKPSKDDVQQAGSVITYMRRFVINAIAGTAGDPDNDGNSNDNDSIIREIIAKLTMASKTHKAEISAMTRKYEPNGKPQNIKDESKLKELLSEVTDFIKTNRIQGE